MIKKTIFALSFIATLTVALPTVVPEVVITFGIANATAQAVVNFILATSTAASIISLIGIIFGVGGLSLAVIQTVKYLAVKNITKAVAW